MFLILIILFLPTVFSAVLKTPLPGELGDFSSCEADCESRVFCQGDVLKTITLARIHDPPYDHPKYFVDQRLLAPEDVIVKAFDKLVEEKEREGKFPLDKDTLRAFEKEYFASDLPLKCKLRDLNLEPKHLLNKIAEPAYQKFVKDIQNIWEELAVRVGEDAKVNSDLHSMVYLPKCYIKAGGFFTSQFYWDSYWIIKGLIVVEMTETVEDMLINFFHLIDKFGHVLNAGRIYYSKRSQPPFLAAMVKHYLDAKPDEEELFLQKYLVKYIEKEFLWWMNNREISFEKDGKDYIMYQYRQKSCYPRPEGYVKDYNKGQEFETDEQRNFFYTQTHSVAESGIDFSTRQRRTDFYERGYGTRKNLDITRLVPVELNSLLAMNAGLLSEWFAKIGDTKKSEEYKEKSETLIRYIDEVFRVGNAWFDWDMKEKEHRTAFYPTNLSPLYTMAYDKKKAKHFGETAVQYLKEALIIHPDGPLEGKPKFVGVPTSMILSPEQWDYRNTWAPMQSYVIEGLYKTGEDSAKKVALELAKIWIKSNYIGLYKNGHMFEKYDAEVMGATGEGGTYTAQTGFGWSNGFVLTLLDLFGHELSLKDYDHFEPDKTGVVEDADVQQ